MDERDINKSANIKFKIQLDENREKLQNSQDINLKLNEQNKNILDINNNLKIQINTMKNQIKDGENEINSLKVELKGVETFILEKERTEKLIFNLTKSVNSMKEDLERKTKKLRQLEKINLELKLQNDENSLDNLSSKKDLSECSSVKFIEKKIKSLESENKKLRGEVKTFKEELNKKLDLETENNLEKSLININSGK